MGTVSRYGKNDIHALAAIALRELSADPLTGHVNYRGKPAGAARRDGYINVSIRNTYDRKKRVTIGAHRICWMVFNGPIPAGMVINHRNGMRWDNRAENLELVTASDNTRHGQRLPYVAVGEQDDNCVSRDFYLRAMHLANGVPSTEEIAALKPEHEYTPQPYALPRSDRVGKRVFQYHR